MDSPSPLEGGAKQPIGAAAGCSLLLLMRALLMTSSHSKVDLKDVQDLSWAKADYTSLQRMFAKTTDELMLLGSAGTEHELQEYTRALDSMLVFCTMSHKQRKPHEIANHQHMLADLRVDDALMSFLSRPFHATKCQWRTRLKQRDDLSVAVSVAGFIRKTRNKVRHKATARDDECYNETNVTGTSSSDGPADTAATNGAAEAVAEGAVAARSRAAPERDAETDLLSSLVRSDTHDGTAAAGDAGGAAETAAATADAANGKHTTYDPGTKAAGMHMDAPDTNIKTESWDNLLVQPEMAAYNSLARRCYSIIRQMCAQNATLGHHIACKYKDKMMIQCQLMAKVPGVDWDIVSVLQAMYTDNFLLIHALTERDLQVYMRLIQDASSVRQHRMYIKLLSLMCAHEKDAIVDAQDAIRMQLHQIMPRTRVNAQNTVEIEKLVPDLGMHQHGNAPQMADVVEEAFTKETVVWRSIEFFAESPENALYLVALTQLLTNLCLGRRRESQEQIKAQFAPFDVALTVLTNRNINAAVRAGFVSLVRQLYVDVDPFESNPINLARVWSDVQDENGARYLARDIEKAVPGRPNWTHDLMDWCDTYFAEEGPHLVVTDPESRFGAPGSLKRRQSSTGLVDMGGNASSTNRARRSSQSTRRGSMRSGSSQSLSPGGSFTRYGWDRVKRKLAKMNEDTRDTTQAIANNVLCGQVLGLLGDMVRHGFCYDGSRRIKLCHGLLDLLRRSARSKDGLLEDALPAQAREAITSAKRAACELLFCLNQIWASNSFLSELLVAFKREYTRDGTPLAASMDRWVKHLPLFANQSKNGGFFWFRQEDGSNASEDAEDTDIEVVCILLDLCQYGDNKLTESSLKLLLGTFNLKGEILHLLDQVTLTADGAATNGVHNGTRPSTLAELRKRKTLWYTAVHQDVMTCYEEIRDLLEWFTSQLDQRLGNETVKLHQKMIRGERIHMAVLQLLREQIGSKTQEELSAKMATHPWIKQLLMQGFSFLGVFAANNETNQGEFVASEVFHFLIGATSLGIGAELALAEILNHSEAVRLVRTDITRTLVHNLFLYEMCRTPSYIEMLNVIVAPKGTVSEEQQTKLVSSITAARNMISRAGILDSSIAVVDEELLQCPLPGSYAGEPMQDSLAMLWKPKGADEHNLSPTQDWLQQVAHTLGRKASVVAKLTFYIEGAKSSATLVGEREEPRTGARYHDAFFGDDFCQVLIDIGLAENRVEAAENGAACVSIGVIDRVDRGFEVQQFLDGRVLYRFRLPSDPIVGQRTPCGSKEFVCEYYLSLARLLSTLAEHNPYTRGILISEAPFENVLEPILGESFSRLNTAAKVTYIELAHTLHVYLLSGDEFDRQDDADDGLVSINVDGFNDLNRGAVDSSTATNTTTAISERMESFVKLVTAIASVMDEAGAELTAWVRAGTNKGDWRERKREAFAPDKYLLQSVLPFCIELLLHSAKLILQAWKLGGESEAKSWPFQALVSSLIERIIDFFQQRQRGPHLDPPNRQRGAALIEMLMQMTQSETYANVRSALFTGAFSGKVATRLEGSLPWWRGEDEYAAQIIEEQAIAARLDPSNESDRIANQLFSFRYQIKIMFAELGDSQPIGDEMLWHRVGDSTDATFSEYWQLVRIIRKFFIEGAENSKEMEHEVAFKRQSASFRRSATFRQSASFKSHGSNDHAKANLRLSATGKTSSHSAAALKRSATFPASARRRSSMGRSMRTASGKWKARRNSRFSARVSPADADATTKKWIPKKQSWQGFIGMFETIFEYFQSDSANSNNVNLDNAGSFEGGPELANKWLRLLCALMAKEDESELSNWNQRYVAKTLNARGLPRLIISLMSKTKTASFAARLGTELCKCSPVETAIEEDPAIAIVHPHSQRAFYEHLMVDKKKTHQALLQFKHAVGTHIERLHRITLGASAYGLDVDESEASMVNSNGVKDVVEFLRYLCMGCYSEMQGLLLRQGTSLMSINVLELISDLAHIHGKVVVNTLRSGFSIGSSPHSKAFPLFALQALRTELNGIELLVQLYRLTTEVSCGPNISNQDALMSHGIVDQMLPVLMYMEAGGLHAGKSVDDVVDNCKHNFAIWQREFGIVLTGEADGTLFECHQRHDDVHDARKAVPTRLLADVVQLQSVLDRLGFVDEECETHIIAAVSALMEGRGSGHQTFDSVCYHLFNDVRSMGGVTLNQSTLMNNLTSHYEKSVEDGSIDTHENGTSGASAMAYYVLLAQLGFNAYDYGSRVNEALEQWNAELGFPFQKRVGRLELVQGRTLISIYFPVPCNITIVNNSAVVKTIKQSIIDETYLLNDQERVRSFLEHAPLVMKIIREQAGYRDGMLKKWLSLEGEIITGALVVSLVLNSMLIAEFDVEHPKWSERHPSWIALGMIHFVLCLLMWFTYVMNHITIDRYNYHAYMEKLPKQNGVVAALTGIAAATTFWMFQTRAFYVFINVLFSCLGNFYNKGFFVLGVYGITAKVHGMGLITKAIFASTPKLMSTVGLAFVVLYTLAVIGETLYKGLYTWPDTETACENNGTDFATCFRDHIYTFGERAVFFQEIPNFGGFMFAVFYNLAVPFLLSGIVVGIITDTFGQLRQRAEEVSNAKQSYCYCCSHSRQELEHGSAHGFDGHVRFEHNPWDFVAFVVHAEEKYARHEHLTGPEMHALKLNIQHKLSLMWPFHRALCVDGPAVMHVGTGPGGAGGAKGTLFDSSQASTYLSTAAIRTGILTKIASVISNPSSSRVQLRERRDDGSGRRAGAGDLGKSRDDGKGSGSGSNAIPAPTSPNATPTSQLMWDGSEYSGGKQSPAVSDRSKSPSIVSGRSSANFAEVPPVPSSARPRAVHADDQILLQELETLTGTRSRSVNRSERSNANVDVSDAETEYEHAEGRGIETEEGEA